GEDDLDAPDLNGSSEPDLEAPKAEGGRGSNGHAAPLLNGRRRSSPSPAAAPNLTINQSAIQRDRLLADLATLETGDAAAAWAHQNLATKNILTDVDAKMVETSFQARLAVFDD